ncbi:hypothetical protein Desaci_4252 [Desulfosporosinus acidiphilus SJ4]|uniref:Uncharacterized protein n=1 Tax=Desulfosporosinus acidiphilus (strain DSM 22704 / JCM 16185 / SJ4) TaxID=646529 RepID=I4DBD5_DESAJ|nr:DUF6773 family protein [Desulfosporosinus acidiphilus]AFM43109.1 hypothetical protein Desaci_4252 [Desulfosporosinus acidiphilus SJ4]
MRKNNLDEMQEKKLLSIEHNGMWLAFWGLLAAIMIQICQGANFKQFAGEWIIFMLLSFYTLIACIKNGIWDRRLKPNLKTNALLSLLAGLSVSVIFGIEFHLQNKQSHSSLSIGSIGIFTFLLCFGALQFSSYLYKKRKEKLERECE